MVFSCDFAGFSQNFGGRMQMGQKSRMNASVGVPVAELEGHVSRFAVCLVHHWEGLGPAPRG